ncbi:MAG TPA: hypothetical protein VIV12_00215, partial [Streptosporangiaceae bacterium]
SEVATTDRSTLRLTLEQINATAAHRFTVFLPDGSVLGAPAARTAAGQLAARGRSLTVATAGGRQILVSVQRATGGPAVITTFVPGAELHRGVARAWLILAVLGVALVLVGVVVADRLAQTMVRPIGELSAAPGWPAATSKPVPGLQGRRRSAMLRPRSTTWQPGSGTCCARNARRWRTCHTGCGLP